MNQHTRVDPASTTSWTQVSDKAVPEMPALSRHDMDLDTARADLDLAVAAYDAALDRRARMAELRELDTEVTRAAASLRAAERGQRGA